MTINIEITHVAIQFFPYPIRQFTHCMNIRSGIQRDSILKRKGLPFKYFLGNGSQLRTHQSAFNEGCIHICFPSPALSELRKLCNLNVSGLRVSNWGIPSEST